MIIRINGTDYSLEEAMDATLGDLDSLETESARMWGDTISLVTINNCFIDLDERREAADFDPVELLADKSFKRTMIAVIWLARRSMGEEVTLAQAGQTKFSEFEFDAEAEVEDPKVLPASAADESAAVPV